MKDERPQFELIFLKFASLVSERSVCQRHGTGAVIVTPDYLQILGYGYNGPPHGIPHHFCTGETGNCGCVHSEINAIIKAPHTPGNILFCTHSPCMDCARYIIQAKISKVVYASEYRDKKPVEYLEYAGIECKYFPI